MCLLHPTYCIQDAVNQLKDLSTASPAIKLFAEWCEKCTEDPLWRGRFKVRAHEIRLK